MQRETGKPSCLVLAGKYVGRECLRFLIDAGEDDIRALLVGSADDGEIFEIARRAGLAAAPFTPAALSDLRASGARFDWLLNLWSPHILAPEALALAERRLNIHPGLVPHCRGNDGAAWALRRRLPAGVSLIEMTDKVDSGGVYAQRRVEYGAHERGRTLHDRLQAAAVALFKEEWPGLRHRLDAPPPQKSGGSHFTRRMTEADRVRAGSETLALEEVVGWALAHDFSPGTTAEIRSADGTRFRVTVEEVDDT